MKKKGLTISTVVMAVVLIASLTTATYAWFSTSASASIDNIAMNVEAASSVVVGLLASDTNSAVTNPANYVSGSVERTATGWTGTENLGSNITTGISLKVEAGVGSGSDSGTSYKVVSKADLESKYLNTDHTAFDSTKTATNPLTALSVFNGTNFVALTAASEYDPTETYYVVDTTATGWMDQNYDKDGDLYTGKGTAWENLTDVKPAIINGFNESVATTDTDAFDLHLGIRPTQAGQYGTYCVIDIDPSATTVGMAAALHFDIKVGSKEYSGDIFGINDEVKYNTPAGEKIYRFWFFIDKFDEEEPTVLPVDSTVCKDFTVKFFVSGYNKDCCADATGKGCVISFKFGSCDGEDWTAADDELIGTTSAAIEVKQLELA